MDIDFQTTIKDLESNDPDVQLPALDRAFRFVRTVTSAAVKTLLHPSVERTIVGDQILKFGSIAIPEIEKLFKTSADRDMKTISALLLLNLGSKEGANHLLTVVRNNEERALLAAITLGAAKIQEAVGPITEMLRDDKIGRDPTKVASLIVALRCLTAQMPDDLQHRLETEFQEPYRTGLLKLWDEEPT
jgi:hypothetical protein